MPSDDDELNPEMAANLTDAYHKARRNLTLTSGILLAWEYVGVQIGANTAELPVAKTPVNLLNPEVMPQVIFLLVIYFAIRLWIEWFQCNEKRRELWPSKMDLFLATLLSSVAVSLFIFQSISGIRVASLGGTIFNINIIFIGVAVSYMAMRLVDLSKMSKRSTENNKLALRILLYSGPFVIMGMSISGLIYVYGTTDNSANALYFFVIGILIGIVLRTGISWIFDLKLER